MNERSYLILDLVRSRVLDLNPTESILASCFFGLLAQNPIQYAGKPYYMADYKNVSVYCPILPNKVDTLRRLYKNLENLGLIQIIKIDNHVCFTPSQMLRDWGTVYKSVEAGKNPVEAEKNPVEAEKNPPYINNINNNIIYNNINNNACARAYDCYEKNIGVIKECVMQEIDSYLDDGVEDEMICAAIEDAAKASRFTWHYVNGILLDKVKRNIKTLSAYKADQKAWENRHNTQKKGFSSSPPQPDADELYRERKPSDEEMADYMAMIGGGRA